MEKEAEEIDNLSLILLFFVVDICVWYFLECKGGNRDQYNDGGGKEPKNITTQPSSSFTVATTMMDDYGNFEGGEGTKSKEKTE